MLGLYKGNQNYMLGGIRTICHRKKGIRTIYKGNQNYMFLPLGGIRTICFCPLGESELHINETTRYPNTFKNPHILPTGNQNYISPRDFRFAFALFISLVKVTVGLKENFTSTSLLPSFVAFSSYL
jgi:hypothetical protein